MSIGIDLGRSRVSAVRVDSGAVTAAVGLPVTVDPASAVGAVLDRLLADDPSVADASAVSLCLSPHRSDVPAAGQLSPVACIRIGPTAAETVPPMHEWPADLRSAVGSHGFAARGGHTFDGRPAQPLDEPALDDIADQVRRLALPVAAITAVFSPVNPEAELRAAALLAARVPGLEVCLSHEIGSLGLLERENAAVANAALLPRWHEFTAAVERVVADRLPRAQVYLAHNDGTVMELVMARRYPVLTLTSGHAASVTGAAALSGHAEAVVVSVGDGVARIGTTTLGHASHGLDEVRVSGIPLDLYGPSVTTVQAAAPDRWTAAELATVHGAVRRADPRGALPVVLVGPDVGALPASFAGERPRHAAFAAATGAALSEVGAEVDCILAGDPAARQAARSAAEDLARQRAVLAGAVDHTIHLRYARETPLAYVPGDVVRLRVKAVGRRR